MVGGRVVVHRDHDAARARAQGAADRIVGVEVAGHEAATESSTEATGKAGVLLTLIRARKA
jgi:hypothetical protein